MAKPKTTLSASLELRFPLIRLKIKFRKAWKGKPRDTKPRKK